MSKMMVALRWDGPRRTKQQLIERASKAVNQVGDAFSHVDQLDIQALADEAGQFVQLIVTTSAGQADCQLIAQMLKDAFVAGPKPKRKPKPLSKADKLTIWCMLGSAIPLACLLSVVKFADRSGDSWFFSVAVSCIAAAIFGIVLGFFLSRIILGIRWIVDLSRKK